MTRRTRQRNSSPVTTSVAERRLMSQVLELQSTVEKLNSHVDILNKTVDDLEEQVKELSPLKGEVQKLVDTNAVASAVSENLSKELERLQQYIRRNCLVLENIPLTKKESLHVHLNATLARFSKCEQVDFIYADIHENLKVRFKEKFNGRYVYSFNDENELSELIYDVESYIYDDDINGTN